MSWSDAFKQKLRELGLDDFAGEPSMEQWRQLLDGIEATLGAPMSPVTRRRAATEDLFQSLYPTFEAITEALPQAVFLLDSRGRVRRTNPVGWGYIETLSLRPTAPITEILVDRHGEVDPDLKIDLEMVLTEHVEPVEGRLDDIAPLPGRGPISYTLTPLTSGGPAVAAVVLHDHTDERQLEEAQQKAEQADGSGGRDQSNFVANTSHELRTPLNGILGMTQLLKDTELASEQREFVDIIHSSGEALLALVNDILDFSKLEAGRMELEQVDFDVLEVIEKVCQVLSERAAELGNELVVKVEDEVPTLLRGDPGRLRQVLMNIVGNAVKFTAQGTVVITVRSMGVTKHVADLRFDIRDTGIGMEADALERIFRPFSQADGSTTRNYGGTGLGLAICRQVVGVMGGAISANSTPGEGSTFWFTTRFDKQPGVEQPELRGGAPDDLKGASCLVMDANAAQLEVVVGLVEALGLVPVTASSGEEAVERLREAGGARVAIIGAAPDGCDALEWIVRLREANSFDQLRVLVSGYGSSLLRAPLHLASEVQHTLLKPVLPGRIARALDGGSGPPLTRPVTLRDQSPVPASSTGEPDDLRARPLLLVAEDNLVNQKVAARLLDKLGYQVHLVGNGKLAVEAAMTGRYAAVLMDCQMPILSGYEATAEIRSQEPEGQRLPVIAMTAHAGEGARQKCVDAGMDDYLTKPIRTPELRGALERWVGLSGQEDVPDEGDDGHGIASVLDGSTLQRLRALEEPGQSSFLREVFEAFLEDAPLYLTSLKEALGSGDLEALSRTAHTWKGSSANLGAEMVRLQCEGLEQMSREGREEDVADALAALESAWETTRDAIGHLPEMAGDP